MIRRLEYIISAEEYGIMTNIVGTTHSDLKMKANELFHTDSNKKWQESEINQIALFMIKIADELNNVNLLLRNYKE